MIQIKINYYSGKSTILTGNITINGYNRAIVIEPTYKTVLEAKFAAENIVDSDTAIKLDITSVSILVDGVEQYYVTAGGNWKRKHAEFADFWVDCAR